MENNSTLLSGHSFFKKVYNKNERKNMKQTDIIELKTIEKTNIFDSLHIPNPNKNKKLTKKTLKIGKKALQVSIDATPTSAGYFRNKTLDGFKERYTTENKGYKTRDQF